MEHDAAVAEAVERLYEVFARYPLPTRLDASPLRDADAILRALRSAPLRKLGAEQLLRYAGWALTTVGGPDEYRHFLPRIVELALDSPPYIGADPQVIAGKVTYPPYKDRWSEEELAALRSAFLAAFRWVLTLYPKGRQAVDWFEGLYILGDILVALKEWGRSTSPHAVYHLASALRTLDDPSDGVQSTMREELKKWLRNAEIRNWFYNVPIPDDLWLLYDLEYAYDTLASDDVQVSSPAGDTPG